MSAHEGKESPVPLGASLQYTIGGIVGWLLSFFFTATVITAIFYARTLLLWFSIVIALCVSLSSYVIGRALTKYLDW